MGVAAELHQPAVGHGTQHVPGHGPHGRGEALGRGGGHPQFLLQPMHLIEEIGVGQLLQFRHQGDQRTLPALSAPEVELQGVAIDLPLDRLPLGMSQGQVHPLKPQHVLAIQEASGSEDGGRQVIFTQQGIRQFEVRGVAVVKCQHDGVVRQRGVVAPCLDQLCHRNDPVVRRQHGADAFKHIHRQMQRPVKDAPVPGVLTQAMEGQNGRLRRTLGPGKERKPTTDESGSFQDTRLENV